MPRQIENTVLRGRTFHFRRAVPADLREAFRRLELSCSLCTGDRRVAQLRARRVYVRSEDVFETIRAKPMISDDEVARIVQDFYKYILDLEGSWRLRAGSVDEEVRLRRARKFNDLAGGFRAALGANDFDHVDKTARMLARNRGVELPANLVDQRRVKQALLRAWVEVATAIKARYEGDFSHEPTDKLLTVQLNASENVPSAASADAPIFAATDPATRARVGGGAVTGETFSSVARAFLHKQRQLKRWENQTAAQNMKTYALFADICGDKFLGAYDRRDAARFKDTLESLPADYGKAARYRGMAVADILRNHEGAGGEGARLAVRTVKRHLSALSALWEEQIPHGLAASNIFSGFKFRQQERAQDQRPMWTRTDLQRLFSTPVWTGCKSPHRRSDTGPALGDALRIPHMF